MFNFKILPDSKQLDSLVLLRGVAVIMVCFCHFGFALTEGHIFGPLFACFDHYGQYGVHVFFVISGFVIPYSLFKGKYHIRHYGRFLYKRLLRLHPPYIAALALTLAIMFLSYKARHMAYPENMLSILKSLIYFHFPADNPVFWTLNIEAQYYLLIGLLYALLMRYPKMALYVVLPGLLYISQTGIAHTVTLFSFLVFFLVGTIGFMIYTNNGSPAVNGTVLVVLLAYSAFYYEFPSFVAALFTIGFILFFRLPVSSILQFPGKISYSIYLIHFPIGIKLINLLKPKMSISNSWILFFVATFLTFFCAWLFYKVFEDYSEKISKRIKYKPEAKESFPQQALAPDLASLNSVR
ncbi:acyltransferase [Paraflavisolibacter sp. H34]|uniref:acyltransferase family protein n=1 Tax=Huijunlia imazamoxiresistens TaxID=3127457 RepID=UPI00301B6177